METTEDAGTELDPALFARRIDPTPRPSRLARIAMRVIPIGCGGVMVLGVAAFAAAIAWRAHRTAEAQASGDRVAADVGAHVERTLREGLADTARASALCGYPVRGIDHVRIDGVALEGSSAAGHGTAAVTLIPLTDPGARPFGASPGPCRGSYRFDYRLERQSQGGNAWLEQTYLSEMQLYRPLAVGQTIEGVLALGDHGLADGALMDDYGIRLRAGHSITLVVRGGEDPAGYGASLDVMGGIYSAAGAQLAVDDDSAGNYNARLIFTPTEDGLYFLRVTHALQGVRQGRYTVVAIDGAHPEAS